MQEKKFDGGKKGEGEREYAAGRKEERAMKIRIREVAGRKDECRMCRDKSGRGNEKAETKKRGNWEEDAGYAVVKRKVDGNLKSKDRRRKAEERKRSGMRGGEEGAADVCEVQNA